MDENVLQKAKLICGIISADPWWFDQVEMKMVSEYGPVDVYSHTVDFDNTNYYDSESGFPLSKKFFAFDELISPDDLADIKRFTNALEEELSLHPKALVPRPVNIDPGYLTPAKLVLASMKDFSHRICLDRGVYAEVTLLFNKGWQTLPWTFPDYASGCYFDFLDSAKKNLMKSL